MRKKIFILGGKGFVGNGFTTYLRVQGVDTVIINRANYFQFIGDSCDVFINANGNSKKYVASDDPKSEFQASVVSVRNSLVDFKYKKYIYLSSGDVYPDCSLPELTVEESQIDISQQSPYGFHKYLAELCVQHVAKDWLIFRQGGFVGPGMKKNAIYDVLYGEKLWVHPDSEFQYIHTIDSARIIMELAALGVTNQVFNLTGTGTIKVRDVMKMTGRNLPWDPSTKPVRYEMSTKKISQYVIIPTTIAAVQEFVSKDRN